jgi:hypothetical protein
MHAEEIQTFIARRLPDELKAAPPEVRLYTDEIVIILTMAAPAPAAEAQAIISRVREESRSLRMQIARDLEQRTGLPIAWGLRCGEVEVLFTTRTVPVMTRLGRTERDVLDTLVAAGVADTRSSALAYTVRAFAQEHAEWLAEVRTAIAEVEKVRERLKLRPHKGPPNV